MSNASSTDLNFLRRPLDVAVDRAVVDIGLIVVSRIHQRIAALDHARPARCLASPLSLVSFSSWSLHGLFLMGAHPFAITPNRSKSAKKRRREWDIRHLQRLSLGLAYFGLIGGAEQEVAFLFRFPPG